MANSVNCTINSNISYMIWLKRLILFTFVICSLFNLWMNWFSSNEKWNEKKLREKKDRKNLDHYSIYTSSSKLNTKRQSFTWRSLDGNEWKCTSSSFDFIFFYFTQPKRVHVHLITSGRYSSGIASDCCRFPFQFVIIMEHKSIEQQQQLQQQPWQQ